jgi:hypothetical protein
MDWIQGIFSIAGDDSSGAGGPDDGAQGCHFIYFPSSNLLYLDGPDGGFQWVGSSLVGGGGTSLSNGYCTVHAGQSSVQAEPVSEPLASRTVLSLTLNIEFPLSASSPQKKHMYSIVHSLPDRWSNGDSLNPVWTYWGWWATAE